MTFKIFKLSVIICLFLISGCSSSDDSNSNSRTYADIEDDFQTLDLSVGINDVSLDNVNGDSWDFRVIIPDTPENLPIPLIITLHGASGGDPNAHKTTACYAEPGFESLDAIIISPNGRNMQWTDPFNQDMVLSLVDLANKYLAVDDSKIVVNGYSNGGNGSWFFGETQPQLFSAAIPMASSYNTYGTDGYPRSINTPMYVIHGEDDELFPLEETQQWIEATKSVGSDITLEVAPGLSHNEPCEYVPYLKHAVTWLQTDIWN